MRLLNTNDLKKSIISDLKDYDFKNKILLLSKNPSPEAIHYKNVIIKRLKEFDISFIDKEFNNESVGDILDFINSFDREDGFIILSPFGGGEDLSLIKEEASIRDLDGFTYKSLGRSMAGDYKFLPATARAIARFLDYEGFKLEGKSIVIANSTNLIGRALSMYLSNKRASVRLINSITRDSKDLIRSADIFVSAIGRASYYDRSYFREGMLVLDVGTSYINGKIVGDVEIKSIEDMDLAYLGPRKGIGAITTITLLEGLKY